MYSEALQRSLSCQMRPPEPCDLPRSDLTKPVSDDSMKKFMGINRLQVSEAVNCRFWVESADRFQSP
jgi:hypothetical protein